MEVLSSSYVHSRSNLPDHFTYCGGTLYVMRIWMTEARILKSNQDGGRMMGGPERRAVWMTTESDTEAGGFETARMLERTMRPVHLVWHPTSGDIIQMMPATMAGVRLKGDFNRHGDLQVHIAVVGWSHEPFTDGELAGLESVLEWLDSWGVPRTWPVGLPLAASRAFGANGQRDAQWGPSGHYGLSQSPGSVHASPGAIDIYRIGANDDAAVAV